ncbi:MAG TPA: hypothetical protein VGI23_18675 [Steroidobacteraceae bacterium]
MRYRTRIVRVIAEARGQRAMIESLDTAGRTVVSTVKWNSLRKLGAHASTRQSHREHFLFFIFLFF